MKKLCCGVFGTIYYAAVDAKGRMRGNREDVTDDAVMAVMEHLASKASEQKPFDGTATIEINGFKLTLDGRCNKNFMAKYCEQNEN